MSFNAIIIIIIIIETMTIIIGIFLSYAKKLFLTSKKVVQVAQNMGGDNSGNARKKTFLFIGDLPIYLPHSLEILQKCIKFGRYFLLQRKVCVFKNGWISGRRKKTPKGGSFSIQKMRAPPWGVKGHLELSGNSSIFEITGFPKSYQANLSKGWVCFGQWPFPIVDQAMAAIRPHLSAFPLSTFLNTADRSFALNS